MIVIHIRGFCARSAKDLQRRILERMAELREARPYWEIVDPTSYLYEYVRCALGLISTLRQRLQTRTGSYAWNRQGSRSAALACYGHHISTRFLDDNVPEKMGEIVSN